VLAIVRKRIFLNRGPLVFRLIGFLGGTDKADGARPPEGQNVR
jgi:hypothetical protein